MSYNGSGTFLINTAGQPVVSGTVISSTAFNALTADLATGLSTAITKDGQTTITANIPMANYKFTGLGVGSAAGDSANLSQVQSTAVKLLASVSGADTITAVGSPNVAAYVAGQMFYFVAAGANTGAVTINIDSLGAKSITRDGTTALAAGDIQSGEVCVIVYDGTQFQLVSGSSQSASIVTNNLTVTNDALISGLTVGKGAGAVATNTAVGSSALAANTTGDENTAIGYAALDANTSGERNVSVGGESLYTNTTGINGTVVGFQAAYTSNADNITAIGFRAAHLNSSGTNNTALGGLALYSNTTASSNTAVGYQAGYNNTTGQFNVLLGYQAGYRAAGTGSIGDASVFIGYTAGYSSQANNNVGIGNGSMYSTTTGGLNVALGTATLYDNTTGANNTAIGYAALENNTTAANNVAVGYQAAFTGTTAATSTAVGTQALYSNSTGNSMTAVGYRALYSQTGAGPNTAVGVNSQLNTTTGQNNISMGYNSAYGLTTGSNNVAVGDQALFSNTTASSNTAVGYQAGYSTTTGIGFTAVGREAGYSNTTASYGTYIGNQAGLNATGTLNTFVGWASGYQVTSGTKNTIIGGYNGNQGGLDIRTSNNYIVLSDGDGNPRIQVTNTGTFVIPQTYNDTTANAANMEIDASGVVRRSTSSLRYKTDVQDATHGLAEVLALRPVTYKGINNGDKVFGGLIAEEVHDAGLTEFVVYDKDGQPDALAYGNMVSVLVKAIQELKAEFDAYKETHP